MSRFNIVSTLQERLQQTRETLTRTSRLDVVSGDVDEIDPPSNIAQYAKDAKQVGIVRENLRKFVNDVWEPGYRLEGPDETVAFFMGPDEAEGTPPSDVPDEVQENGFLDVATIFAGEKAQPFYYFGKQCTWERRVRGTVLVELLKQDPTDAESLISGFNFIAPETVYPRVIENTNILLPPDPEDLPDGIDLNNVETTKRDELAAYVQFDDQAILGRFRDAPFSDENEIPLSQNDVKKQVYEPDIGSPGKNDSGVFGTSVIEAINDDIAEYQNIKRDRATAIKTKAYGIWTAQFDKEINELPDGNVEITEWDDGDMDALTNEIDNSGPGDVVTHDGNIELDRLTGEVPELDPVLKHYVDDILAPLPAPKYKIGFADEINRDVTGEQNDDYDQTISEEREYQERWWTDILRFVARRWDLDVEGLQFKIEPEPSDSPIKSLTMEEIEKIDKYSTALAELSGPQAGPQTLVDRETLLTDIAQLPEDSAQEMADELGKMTEDAETQQAFEDILDVESLANQYSEGDEVDTPDGVGVVVEVRTEDFEGPSGSVEASSDSPAYVVATQDGAAVYRASDLTSDSIDVDVENPESDLEAMADLAAAGDVEVLQDGRFEWPESWEESDQPARVIALKAWAGLGGRFTTCRREMAGEIASPERFCADFKDRILQWEGWRQGG